jgi:hypothetical protein
MDYVTFSKLGELGRLGNQFFQVASSIGIAKANNKKFIFPYQPWMDYLAVQLPYYKSNNNLMEAELQGEYQYRYSEYKLDEGKDHNLFGFFQSPRYWKHCEDLIRQIFTLNENYMSHIHRNYGLFSGPNNTCGIHVRRADYLTSTEQFNQLTIDYYSKAFKRMPSGLTYLIFSDDIAWCLKMFNGPNVQFIQGEEPIIDLFLMSYCRHNIIANSSFSWWGAYLNRHEDKKVIYPKNWFGPHLKDDHPIPDLIPEGWEGVDN